jgi:type IV secretory pathway VirB9-like protein
LATLVPGGQKYPPRDAAADAKIKRLEEEAERLRSQIVEKQKAQRTNLREWNKMSQETESARLRAEFAEENVARINGEESSGPAF